jgi:serine/threonine protein kinase
MIISGAAAGLHHAHERRGKNGAPLNIVHRDVSPANIMVGYDGSVKVLDFGIAKAEERTTKTVGGMIKGKYGYMAPEQCKGKPVDRRSDIFALGIVLYELSTLRRAFKGNDDFETMTRIVAGDVVLPSIAVPGYPRELEAIVLTAMATDPDARFQTGQELIEALDAFAVRAKLTGSNTALGRFMTQLFGSKKEPWADGAPPDKTETSVESDTDNEKTTIRDHRGTPARAPREAMRISGEHETLRGAPLIAPALPAKAVQNDADAAAWQAEDPAHEQRQSARNARPTLDIKNGSPAPSAPALSPTDELGKAGAKPLVSDPKLGFETSPANRRDQPHEGSGARLQTEPVSEKIISTKIWWLLALVLVLGAIGLAVALYA